jgi:MFS family permease
VQAAGWRWVFLLNLPLAVLVIAVTARHVPETRDPSAGGRFDVAGAALAALALAGITYALIEATGGGGVAGAVTAAVAGVAAAIAFVRVERHRGRSPDRVPPMLPLDVFASRQFTSVNGITFLVYGAFGGVIFLLVLQLCPLGRTGNATYQVETCRRPQCWCPGRWSTTLSSRHSPRRAGYEKADVHELGEHEGNSRRSGGGG